MTIVSVAVNVLSPIFNTVALGALLSRRFQLETRTLSTVTIYLFSPFLVLGGLAEAQIEGGEIALIMGLALLMTAIMAALSLGTARLLHFDRRLESAFILTAVLINAGNYGLPLNEFAYGQAGLQRAIIFFATTSLVSNTLGVFLASRGNHSSRQALTNVFKVPLLYGLIAGLFLNITGVQMPLPVARTVDLLGQAAVPCMLVVLGFRLSESSFRIARPRAVLLAAGMRLIAGPLIMLVLATLAGVTGVTRQVVLTQAAMPTAIIAAALAIQFDADAEFVTSVVVVATLASALTLAVLLTLLGVR